MEASTAAAQAVPVLEINRGLQSPRLSERLEPFMSTT